MHLDSMIQFRHFHDRQYLTSWRRKNPALPPGTLAQKSNQLRICGTKEALLGVRPVRPLIFVLSLLLMSFPIFQPTFLPYSNLEVCR